MHECMRRHLGRSCLELFADTPKAHFGIHNIVEESSKKPGEFLGPQSVAYCLKLLLKKNPIERFKYKIFLDGYIYLDKITKYLDRGDSVMLAIPLCLGIKKITPEYLESLKHVFKVTNNLGIAGGQSQRSYYFTGLVNPHIWPDPYLTYLDPHFVQDAVVDQIELTEQ